MFVFLSYSITFAARKNERHESALDCTAAYNIQHIHDLCLVRASETAGDEGFLQLAPHPRHPVLMGGSLLRILRPGTGQQDRVQRKRRTVQHHAAQGDTGSRIPYRVYGGRHPAFQEPDAAMEPFGGIHLPHTRGILRLYEIGPGKFQEIVPKISENFRKLKKNLE